MPASIFKKARHVICIAAQQRYYYYSKYIQYIPDQNKTLI
jgi:hypothetical protein